MVGCKEGRVHVHVHVYVYTRSSCLNDLHIGLLVM